MQAAALYLTLRICEFPKPGTDPMACVVSVIRPLTMNQEPMISTSSGLIPISL